MKLEAGVHFARVFAMVKHGIKIYARVRPTKKATAVSRAVMCIIPCCRTRNTVKTGELPLLHNWFCVWQSYEVGETEESVPTISFTVPRSEAAGYVNNKREVYSFR